MRILATSREALHVAERGAGPGRAARVPGSTATEGRSAAVELFLERARAARPGFEPDGEAVALAAEIARRVDGLPLAIELAAARVNVLGLAELALDPRAPRGAACATARHPIRPAPRCKGSSTGATTSCTATRRRCSISSPSTAAAPRSPRSSRSRRRTASTRRPSSISLGALVDKSIVSASFSGGAARYDMLDSVREYVLERLAESGGSGCRRAAAHAEYFATAGRGGALRSCAGAEWLRWQARLELENDNFWAALAYAREAPDSAVGGPARDTRLVLRAGRARLRGAALPRARSRRDGGRRAGRAAGRAARHLCYLAAEELDLGAALAAGERALALAATAAARRELGLAQLTLAHRPRAIGGRANAPTRWRELRCATLEAAGDDWGVAASGLIRAVACGARRRRRHGRRDGGCGPPSFGRARVRRVPRSGAAAGGVGRGATAGTARARWRRTAAPSSWRTDRVRRPRRVRPRRARRRIALAGGDLREAEELGAQALARPRPLGRRGSRPARASSSHACAAAAGDADTAERLYRAGPRLVAGAAAAPGAREPVRRARRQPGDGGAAGSGGARRRARRHRRGRRAPRPRGARAHLLELESK